MRNADLPPTNDQPNITSLINLSYVVKDVVPSIRVMTYAIGFLLYPGYRLIDLAGPMSAFASAGSTEDSMYRVHLVSINGGVVSNKFGIAISTLKMTSCVLDTLVVIGGAPYELDPSEIKALRSFAPKLRRIGSVCTGAFLLAQCGLLDGRRATTHWRKIPDLERQFSSIRVEPDAIFVKDGGIWTSAGTTAGIDLALAMIEEDFGPAVALDVSKDLVVYYRRPGGQSQFSTLSELSPESDRIKHALAYAREHLREELSVSHLAEVACLSPRQFGRLFRQETGETPAKAIERLRAEAAKVLVEGSIEPIEDIASNVGFSDPERMRRAFIRLYAEPPQGLRRKARR